MVRKRASWGSWKKEVLCPNSDPDLYWVYSLYPAVNVYGIARRKFYELPDLGFCLV
jgi:hypothetical protein